MQKTDETMEGYIDGIHGGVEPGPNRSATYRHGWMNGRDDRMKSPRASAATLLEAHEMAIAADTP